MVQKLKTPGGTRTWRDEARFMLRQGLGDAGDILGEGFLGENEEDKYLEFLQRTYGSELPRDAEGNLNVPESRPLGESLSDPSDFGAIDKLLIPLSGFSSVAPRLALGAGVTETGMLLGDAQGEYNKGNTMGSAIMTALAGLPIALASRGKNKDFIGYGKDAVSGLGSFIRNINPAGQRSSMVTPEGVEMPFYEKRAEGIAGLFDNQKLNVTPTKFNRVLTDRDSVDRAAKGGPSNIANKENVETLLERSILNNPVQNIDKKYSIKDFLQQTKTNLSKSAHSGFDEQIRQFVSPETLAGRFTVQELLDDIGKNKPTITEQVSDTTPTDPMSIPQYYNFMPFIPKYEIPRDLSEASQTIKPTRYIESNFAINSPTLGKMWEDPGHKEVGAGVFSSDNSLNNTQNRIFTARSGIYDINNEKVLIPAESQSGIYGLAEKTAELSLGKQPYSFAYFNDLLAKGGSIRSETGDDIIPFLKPGKSLDDFEELISDLEIDRAMSRSSALDQNAIPENIKEIIRDEPTVTEDLLNGMLVGENNTKRFRDGVAGYIRDMKLADTDIANNYARKLSNLTTVGDKDSTAPLFKDWFPLRMKSALNLASEEGVDRVRFPINDYALAMQRGEEIHPAQTRNYMGEATEEAFDRGEVYDPDFNPSGTVIETVPSEKARKMAIKYKNFTEKGLKRIEAEYGVELNAKIFEDENLNKFYDIEMTPELRKAFETLVYKNGGLVQKPLMPLKYGY